MTAALDPATLRYIADRLDRLRDASTAADMPARIRREVRQLRGIATRNEQRRARVGREIKREPGLEFVSSRPA